MLLAKHREYLATCDVGCYAISKVPIAELPAIAVEAGDESSPLSDAPPRPHQSAEQDIETANREQVSTADLSCAGSFIRSVATWVSSTDS